MMSCRSGRAALGALMVAVAVAVTAPVAVAQAAPEQGPGGPILVITSAGDPFTKYYSEILRAEGMNEFATADVASVDAATLARYDVALLAPTALDANQVSLLSSWVGAGGNLIAMRPDKKLAPLLGLTDAGSTLANAYLGVDTGSAAGAGITSTTMQFHGTADGYGLSGASKVATLYSSAAAATANPAVTLRSVGTSGGQAAAFTFDLARSVVYTRQGNPDWAGDERDGTSPIRSDDLFFGAKAGDVQPNWVDLTRVAIPQADEQQRLLANVITQMTLDRTPLPRFWYLPRGEKATVVMTGDDHATGGTSGRFAQYKAASPSGCSVASWECIRGTSYVFPGTPNLSNAQVASFQQDGFEIGLHLNTGCSDFTTASLAGNWDDQLSALKADLPSMNPVRTNRTHCIAWSDWAGEPKAELAHGVRFDTNYYYWPPEWVNDHPGMFTGSGFPMRFADLDGSMIDVYQAATQMTDESGQSYPYTIDTLLDRALGSDGYYGVFTANMHTDDVNSAGADAIVASAKARGVPVVSAAQMLDWIDGRNDSSFGGVSFTGAHLQFSIARGAGSNGLEAMVPASASTGALTGLTRNGVAIGTTRRVVKGIAYQVFDGTSGSYVAQYGDEPTSPPSNGGGGNGAGGGGGTGGTTPGTGTTAPGGGGSAGGGGATTDRTAPRVTIATRTVRASRTGVVRLRVACPAGETSCRIELKLTRGTRTLAHVTKTVAGGKSATLTLRLTSAARRQLSRAGALRVVAALSARDAAGNHSTTTSNLKLLAPRRA